MGANNNNNNNNNKKRYSSEVIIPDKLKFVFFLLDISLVYALTKRKFKKKKKQVTSFCSNLVKAAGIQ